MKKKLKPTPTAERTAGEQIHAGDPRAAPGNADGLRQHAEALIQQQAVHPGTLPENDPLRLVHELRVYQVELEMQNEELVRARDAAAAGLERYTELYDFAPVGYFSLAGDGTIRQLNLNGAALLGGTRAELGGRAFVHFVSHESRPTFTKFLANVLLNGEKQACEVLLRTCKDPGCWVRLEGVAAADGEACRLAAVDLSERKQAEEVVQASEKKYRQLFENMAEGFALHEIIEGEGGKVVDFRFLDVNPAYERHTGMTKDVIGKTMLEALPEADQRQIEAYGRVALSGEPLQFEYFSKTYQRHLRIRAFCPQHGRFATVFEDITASKQAEEVLRESEKRFRQLFESSMDGILLGTPDGRILNANPAACRLLGRTEAEIIHAGRSGIMDPSDPALAPLLQAHDRTGFLKGELSVIGGDGSRFPCELASAEYLAENGEKRVNVFIRDISERKAAEANLRESEAKYRALFETSMDGILMTGPSGKILAANPAACAMLRETEAELKRPGRPNLVDSSDARLEKAIEKSAIAGTFRGELSFLRTDGSRFPVELSSVYYQPGEGEARVNIIFHDISQRNQRQATIDALGLRNQTLLATATDGIHVLDMEGNIVDFNPAFCGMLGYAPEELAQLNVADWDLQWRREALLEKIRDLVAQPAMFETRQRRKDGSTIEVEINTVGVTLEGRTYLYASARDITERKQAQEALAKSEARFRTVIDVSPVPMTLNDEQQNVTYLNPAFTQTFGYTLEDIPTLADWWPKAFPYPEYRQWVADTWQARLEQARQSGKAFDPLEVTIHGKDGSDRNVIASAAPISNAFEYSYLVVLYDISALKQATADLHDSEEKYRAIFNNAIYGIAISDLRTLRLLDVNERFCRMLGYTREELMAGMSIYDYTADIEGMEESIRVAGDSGGGFIPLRMHRKKDGTLFPVEIVNGTYEWRGKKVIFALLHDITQRRQMETELLNLTARLEQRVVERTLELQQANHALADAQEAERRALALELHDELGQVLNQVKLSLDMAPLLGKEGEREQYVLASGLVRELINRVRRISLELRPAMLDDLGLLAALNWLFNTYNEQDNCQVLFTGRRLEQRFSGRVEIAAYRIVQESLTNISRHAQNKSARVEIGADEAALHISISDQGGGFDVQAVLEKKSSTGLSGMRERARQLGGDLVIESTPGQGTRITADLPLK